jgi:NADH dehydrogenase
MEVGSHRVVIVGGGFGGLQAAVHLARAPVQLTLIDRRNFHLFQPLTYQVATGALAPEEVCYPLRAIFKRRRNVRVVMGEVADLDLEARAVRVEPVGREGDPFSVDYDTLVVAGGSAYSYFGHDEWQDVAPEVKSLESAVAVRGRILSAFEEAEVEPDEDRRRELLTFVVVGAGPTGVEMAGQIGELARDTLRRDFRSIDTGECRVLLVEMADRVLTGFPPKLSASAARQLEHLGVTPLLERQVVGIDERSVTVQAPDGGANERIPSTTVIWAAGVTASTLASRLAERAGARPCRTRDGGARSHLPRAPGGVRARRHGPGMRRGRRRPDLPRGGAGGDAAEPLHREAGASAPARTRQQPSIPLPRQEQPGDDRPCPSGRRPALPAPGRLPCLAHVARRPPAVPGRLPEHLLVFIRWSFSFFTRGRGGRLIEFMEHI